MFMWQMEMKIKFHLLSELHIIKCYVWISSLIASFNLFMDTIHGSD